MKRFQKTIGSNLHEGWESEVLLKGTNKGRGYAIFEVSKSGQRTGMQIRFSPGYQSGRKGGESYWRVNSGQGQAPPEL